MSLRIGIIPLLCVALALASQQIEDEDVSSIETFLLSKPGAKQAESALVQELADEATAAWSDKDKKKLSPVVFYAACGAKGGSKSYSASGSHDLTWAQSVKVPKGVCAHLFQAKGFTGKFLKVTGPSTVSCLKNIALSSDKTVKKNWAKNVRSIKVSACAPLSAAEKNANKKHAAAAEIKALTKNAYKGGKSLKSIAAKAIDDVKSNDGAVKSGKASDDDAKKVKAKIKGLPVLAAAGKKKSGKASAVLDPLAKRITVCTDKKGFKDAKGRNCAKYTYYDLKLDLCKKYGKKKYGGKTANDYCCACNGGTKNQVPVPQAKKIPLSAEDKKFLAEKAAFEKNKGKRVGPPPVNPNWYDHAKNHKEAWKKFVVPYPKFDAKDIKTWHKDGMPDDVADEKGLNIKNGAGKNNIDGGLHIVHDPHKGFVSDDARTVDGYYYIGRRRRRIGAGFHIPKKKKVKRYVVRRRSAMPGVGITDSKLTGKTPGGKPRCTHMKLKYKKKWPYCKKLTCFGGKTLKQAKKKCRKDGLCIGFTFDHGAKKNGGGCYLAPPCRFFGTGPRHDYWVKDFKCPKVPKGKPFIPHVSRHRPKPVPPLKGYSSGAMKAFEKPKGAAHALEDKSKKTKELAAVMHSDLAAKKIVPLKQDCKKCVAEFKAAGGCTLYVVRKKDPSHLIPKGCSTCNPIKACHAKGYNKKVKSTKAAKKALVKKVAKALAHPVSKKKKLSVKRTYKEMKKEEEKEKKEAKAVKKEVADDKRAAMVHKIEKHVGPAMAAKVASNVALAKAGKVVTEDTAIAGLAEASSATSNQVTEESFVETVDKA